MHKHPDLTYTRCERFLKNVLQAMEFGERHPLTIEYCDEPHATEAEAALGKWKQVHGGFKYGPAYRTVWFRLTGEVPKSMAGKALGFTANVGGERTYWKDNSPHFGVDGQHQVCPLVGSDFQHKQFRSGEVLTLYIQVYTTNPQCRVYLKELPREKTVETVVDAELVSINTSLKPLLFDFEFAFDLLNALPKDEPAYAILLRALNEVCNRFRPEDPGFWEPCRKLIRDALGEVNSEFPHTLFPVGHSHLDTAWLWPIDITKKKMAHTSATQLFLMEMYPDYTFVHSQASQYEWIEQEYPKLWERIKKRVREGRWEPVGSMWVEADCNLAGGEALVRQFLYGRRYFREKLKYETQDMWLPDVFGYSAALPQILNKFNIRYFLTQKISWNQFNRFPHNTFWWCGIDGSKIWSHFPPADTYIADCTPKQIVESIQKHKDHARSNYSLYLFGWGDGGGGPTERHIEYIKRAKSAPMMPEIQYGKRAIDFYKEARAKSKDLPVWSGELYLELHRGTYTSQAATKKGNRVSEFLLRDAELLACFSPNYPKQYPAEELESAWKLTLLNQFHDILPGSSVQEVYRDATRDYQAIAATCEKVIEGALQEIGSKLDTSTHEHPHALFQNSSVSSQGEIPAKGLADVSSLICGEERLPVQWVDDFGDEKIIFETPVEALGSVAVGYFSDAVPTTKYRLRASNRKIENSELSVRFDANGHITSVQSLEDGTEFIEPGKLANVFQLFQDVPNFWTAWDIDLFAHETVRDLLRTDVFEVVERGPVRVAVYLEKAFGSSTIRQKISLGPTPGIRFDTEIDWHETDKLLKVAFPVNINSLRATYEIQYGHVERPTHYNTTWDMARFEVPAQKWVDLSEADQGVALLNDCKYGHDIHGNVIRQTLLRSPKAPDPECDMGRHRFTYVLLPHYGPLPYAGVVQAGYSLNSPVRTAALRKHVGEVGQLPVFVQIDDRNMVIESVKKAEKGDSIIVRAYECHNSRGWAELSCAKPISRAALCDLEENEVQDLVVSDGVIQFPYKPFEILTFKLRC